MKHRDPPPIVPEELLGREYACSGCGLNQPVNWMEKQPYPKESVAGTKAVGHWVPVSFSNTCSRCRLRNDIRADTTPRRGSLTISADEAVREVAGVSLFLLAGLGIAGDKRAVIECKVAQLEHDLARESGGTVKAFHAKDIMDRKVWPDRSLSAGLKYVRRMAKIARTNRVSKFITVGAMGTADAAQKRYLRDQVFSAYTLRTLELCTNAGVQPRFAFDQVQRGKKNGWAEECMVGIRRFPLFVWFSRGCHVPDIDHIEPGSTLESKIADCLAYITAREFERQASGLAVDVNTEWFGDTHFSGFNDGGDLIYADGVGFPWRKVFGSKGAR
ncbi:hypothetical protein [Sphingomonas sp. F9_3S_D5_B_2]